MASEALFEERYQRLLRELGIEGEPSAEIKLQARITVTMQIQYEQERAEETKRLGGGGPASA